MKADTLRKRLDRLEAKSPAVTVTSITWIIVEPGPDGPMCTGEVVTWRPGEPNPWQADHAPG